MFVSTSNVADSTAIFRVPKVELFQLGTSPMDHLTYVLMH